ncbi:hypothetical protein ABK040_010261 [Willaertia magna]
MSRKLNIAFTHPDLGIGGAERLIVDAAVGLQEIKGHEIIIYTTHHDKNHCFKETRDGTLNVKVFGDFIPRTLFGYFYILFVSIRMFYLTLRMYFSSTKNYDIIIVDQYSYHLPLLKYLFPKSKIIFYCHFPDKLLVQYGNNSFKNKLKSIYRLIFDYFEEVTTGKADKICVNSEFTKEVFFNSFKKLAKEKKKEDIIVLYPPINVSSYDIVPEDIEEKCSFYKRLKNSTFSIVSINRFERKKNVELLVKAFIKYVKPKFNDTLLILAGGYDPRVEENVQVLNQLKELVKENNIEENTIFVPSFNDTERYVLLNETTIVAYTPEKEHFGIVPIEAMYCRRCVVALKSGGPKESVIDNRTGLLAEVDNTNEEITIRNFGDNIVKFLEMSAIDRKTFGDNARERVIHNFTLNSFTNHLDEIIVG